MYNDFVKALTIIPRIGLIAIKVILLAVLFLVNLIVNVIMNW